MKEEIREIGGKCMIGDSISRKREKVNWYGICIEIEIIETCVGFKLLGVRLALLLII
jgi:hypothetical protein